eukprot:1222657-Amphidinium_carterae.1
MRIAQGSTRWHLLYHHLSSLSKWERGANWHCSKVVHEEAGNHVLGEVQENLMYRLVFFCNKHGSGEHFGPGG